MKRVWLFLLLASLLWLSCAACAETNQSNGAFYYVLEADGTVTVEQYVGEDTSVTIPDTLSGAPVRRLSAYAFSNRGSMVSITLPDGIESIPWGCFSYCPAQIFTGIDGSTAKALSMSGYSFSVSGYPNASLRYTFDGITVKDLEISARSTGIKSLEIPKKVTAIAPEGYKDCRELTQVYLPEGITGIGESAFEGCLMLEAVSLPESLVSIGDKAFRDCVKLQRLDLPDGLRSIPRCSDEGPFENCPASLYTNLMTSASLTVSRAGGHFVLAGFPNAALKYTFDGSGAVSGLEARRRNDAITEADIPNGVTAIASGGFYGCEALRRVYIPEGVAVIRANAFEGCASLTRVTLPDSLTSIESWAFKGCASLKEIELPDRLSSIAPGAGSWPFSDCPTRLYASLNGAAALTVSKARQYFLVTGYPNAALQYQFNDRGEKAGLTVRRHDPALIRAAIPKGVTAIEENGFADCASLQSVDIPDTVTAIGANAFPKKLETLNVGCVSFARKWVEEQQYPRDTDPRKHTFQYHIIHAGIIVPNISISPTETTPGSAGGTHCSACDDPFVPACAIPALQDMLTVRLPAGLTAIEAEAFTGMACNAVIIPEGCRSIGSRAFADCRNLIYVRIPASVTAIAGDAFEGCAEGLIQDYTQP